MSEGHRVSLTFGDTPDEELAYAILQSKGRKKAVYVAQCIKAYEKRRSSLVSEVPESSLTILKTLLEQIVRSIHPTDAQTTNPENTTNEPNDTKKSFNSINTTESPEQEPVNPFSIDEDALSQALDALSAFDSF